MRGKPEGVRSNLENPWVGFPHADLVGEHPRMEGRPDPKAVLENPEDSAPGAARVRPEPDPVAFAAEAPQNLGDVGIQDRRLRADRAAERVRDGRDDSIIGEGNTCEVDQRLELLARPEG